MDAVELLKRMKAACKTECFCYLRLDSDGYLVLRWMGELKVSTHKISPCRANRGMIECKIS